MNVSVVSLIDIIVFEQGFGYFYENVKKMPGKTSKQFFFETQLNWLTGTTGVLTAHDADGEIHVATPPEFGGQGRPWSPEHLFLSSISSCFMATYLAFAKRIEFEFTKFECNVIGQIEIVEGKYKFTTINVYPRVYIANEDLKEKATLCFEKAHAACLISNSIRSEIFYHSQVSLDIKSNPVGQ